MKIIKILLNILAAGLLIVMIVSVFSTAFAIGSLEEGLVTYEGCVRWQVCSILTFGISGVLAIVAGVAADKAQAIKKPPTVRQHR